MEVGWEQALAWRAGRQLLVGPAGRPSAAHAPGAVVEAARAVGGVQAQVASSAELAIGIRTGAGPEVVRTALWEDRALVKTWAMRGTLHLFPADELGLWVAALRAKEDATRRTAAWERYHGVTVAQLGAITGAIGAVLGDRPLTRAELGAEVAAATGDPSLAPIVTTAFGGTILKSAAAHGDLCFGPDRGRNVTFVDPKRWLAGQWDEPDAGAATRIVVHRFLDAYGPATVADFARWWGVPPAEGKRIMRSMLPGLVQVDIAGAPAWVTPAGAESLSVARPLRGHVRLLPAFDPYVLAPHSHRAHAWPAGLHDRISRAAGWISPVLLVDGMVTGVWSHERRGGAVRFEIEPFSPLAAKTRTAAEAAASRLEPLAGAPISVSWAS